MEKIKIISYQGKQNGRNYSGDKELTRAYSLVVSDDSGKPKELAVVRCWMGRSKSSSIVYASVWVHAEDYAAGSGKAGGYGYHKASQAIAYAIESAGIALSQDIGGRGDSAIQEALEAIAMHFGFNESLIISHA